MGMSEPVATTTVHLPHQLPRRNAHPSSEVREPSRAAEGGLAQRVKARLVTDN
jgi:hypothetical protein